jgi:hypothetical protein
MNYLSPSVHAYKCGFKEILLYKHPQFLSQDLDGDSSVTYAFLEHSVMPNNANATILFILVLMETPEQEFISHKPPLLRR